ncbi:protein translocase subunit SecD [Streptomyces otsuchiensis]|uniref:protein translocase subunit SecD n=1 Tax=Streptomyces otsuchiensis TaxID=2681388 RepID=UPI0010315886|nr:protein translocase subunit SecD [Streptomyces otsuchiensis]
MAGPNQGLRSPKKDFRSAQAKPGRALLLILLLAVLLSGGMLLSGEKTPRMGIDLAGGTSITLTATSDARNEDAVNATNLNTAVDIIERRVNGLGVSEVEVQTQGDRNIVINIPQGTDEQQAREQVGTTAQLGFRPVWDAQMAGVPGEETPGEEPPADEEATPEDGAAEDGAVESEDGDTEDSREGDEEAADRSDRSLPELNAPAGVNQANQASFRTQDDDGTDAPEDEESESPVGDNGGEPQPGGLSSQLAELDCSTVESRQEASNNGAAADDSEPIVACDTEGVFKYELGPVAVPGTDVSSADSLYDSQTGQGWIVNMEFNSAGATKFADITNELRTQMQPRNQFAIALDGEVVSAPRVSERLAGGSATISGSFNEESSRELANILKFGALPISFEVGNVTTVSPTLGGDQLQAGLVAGGIGLLLVFGYLLFYYRALSLVAIGSLVVMAGLTYAIMTLLGPAIGFALSLPAVCGAIVAIGITADSFIVYFERIRDEVREGRPIRTAVERAWPRARRTIVVSDVVSFLAAVVLFIVSVGSVQGFAFVLGLTTALDVVIVFLLTKPLVTLAARRPFFAKGHKWSGLDPKRLGARPPIRRSTRRTTTVPAEPKEA